MWTPPWAWVFGVATCLSLFSWLQAWRLTIINMKPGMSAQAGKLLVLNLAYWYLPALLIPAVVWAARRFPFDTGRTIRAIAAHAVGALTFAFANFVGMMGMRFLLWTDAGKWSGATWAEFAQRRILEQLDWNLMVYGVIVGMSHAIAYYHESQERKLKAAQLETRLVEARLKTLEAELHPHFLFNTLHAISTLVHTDPEAADRMISRLSDLLRLTFDRSGAAGVPLKEELEFLQKYLEIEQIRFQDRLSVKFDIDPETLDTDVPRMILQPLVENAIKHGIGPRSGQGLVQISARKQEDKIWIEVRDNGVGLSRNARVRFNNGVGLSNTRARLECLYGAEQRLDFAEEDSGLSVRMLIPSLHPVRRGPDSSPQVALA